MCTTATFITEALCLDIYVELFKMTVMVQVLVYTAPAYSYLVFHDVL